MECGSGIEKRHVVENTNTDGIDSVEDVDNPTHAHAVVFVVPNAEQLRWDGKDAQAHALIAFSVKRAIIPHIRSCNLTKDVWDTLTTLYQTRNDARVAYLRKQLESEHMNEFYGQFSSITTCG